MCWPKPHFWLKVPARAYWGLLAFLVGEQSPAAPAWGGHCPQQHQPCPGPRGSQHGWSSGLGRDTRESPHTKNRKWPRGRVSDPEHSPGALSIGDNLLPLSSVWQDTGRGQEGTGRMQHLALTLVLQRSLWGCWCQPNPSTSRLLKSAELGLLCPSSSPHSLCCE